MRCIVRKKGLPEFNSTRSGIFSTAIVDPSENAFLRKRERSREDNGDEDETACDLQRGREVLLPW